MAGRWRETSPQELRDWLEGIQVPWAFAGGWALDLWAGRQSRQHSDIEITCLRHNLSVLIEALPTFEAAVARNKQLSPWHTDICAEPAFSLWLRRHGEILWDFEIVSEILIGDIWRYRRHEEITLPKERLFQTLPNGWAVIAPEIQLLYKCKNPRDKDVADLQLFWPLLGPLRQTWLRNAVSKAHPEALPLLGGV